MLRLRPATGPDEWNAELRRLGATPFHGWEWLHLAGSLLGGRTHALVAVRDDVVVGLAPVILTRHHGVTKANVVPFQYLGPLADPADLPDLGRALRRWALRHAVAEMQLMFHPEAGVPADALEGSGFKERRDTTYVVPLAGRTSEEVFAGLGRSVRNAIRRSARNGVVVRRSTPDELRHLLPRLHQEAVGHHVPMVPAFGAYLAEGTRVAGVDVASFTALVEDRPVGLALMLHGDITMGWLGGVFRGDQPTGAYTALMWASIEAAIEAGDRMFDMLGAPDEGIARYKQGFRPLAPSYGEWSWSLPLFKLVQRVRTQILARRALGA